MPNIDLTTLSGWSSLSSGSHNITIVAKADGYKDSKPSAAVSVTKGYSITVAVTNGTYAGDTTITNNATITITADSGYKLPNTVTVTGASYTWNKQTGTLALSNPTGAVTVSAVCVEKAPQGYTITINNIGDYGTYQIIRGSETVDYDVGQNKGSHTYNNVTAIGIMPYNTCTISNGTGNFVNGNIYGLLEITEDSTATLTWVD